MPRTRTAWVTSVRPGWRRAITGRPCAPEMDFPLDVAELHDREADHDRHENDRLRGRSPEIEADEPVLEDLVDQDLGRAGGAAAGDGVHDAERLEEGVHDVDDDEEEHRRRQEREHDAD